MNGAYWFAETDAHLLSAALLWIKTISCTVLLSRAALSCLLQLCLTSHRIAAETAGPQSFPRWCLSITAREDSQLQLDSCSHRQLVYITPDDCNSLWSYKTMLSSVKERVRMGGWVGGGMCRKKKMDRIEASQSSDIFQQNNICSSFP